MATRKASAKTEIAKWDEELAAQAEVAAGMEESSVGGQFFSIKSGVLQWNDAPLPDNQMAVIIVDSVLENVFYEEEYDANNPSSPTCFAFGRDEKTMAPHEAVVAADQAVSDQCDGCPNNEFGSAERGRGKACRNVRRLGLIPAGTIDKAGRFEAFDDPEHFATAAVGFMKLPVTSVKGYATFVKQIAGTLRRPPHGIFTKVRVVPDAKSQFKVLFEPLENVPNELLGAVMERHKEVASMIEFPYSLGDEEEAPQPARRGANKKAAPKKKAAGRKY